MERWWNVAESADKKYCPSANYSTIDLTCTELGSNPDLDWETPTNSGPGPGRSAKRDIFPNVYTAGS